MTGHVLVVGDLMLDRSETGTATRLSPEAPVVVLRNPVRTSSLGGAGNAAANIASLGGSPVLVGAVGDDEAGDEVLAACTALGVGDGTVRVAGHPTTVKTRFLAGPHQVLRLDVEADALPDDVPDRLADRAVELLDGASAVVLSDYAKGAVTAALAVRVVEAAAAAGVPVVVDTKRTDVSCFAGCTVLTPNHHEAQAMTGESDPERAAAAIAATTRASALVTLGAQGMLLHSAGEVTRISTDAESVADVTGAGDTVTAALAVALAEGADLVPAARWANAAAAVAVAHLGTFAVPRSALGPVGHPG